MMVKDLTTQQGMRRFTKYIESLELHGCRRLEDVYTTYSTTKKNAWIRILERAAQDKAERVTVVSAGSHYYSVGYVTKCDDAYHFVYYTSSGRTEYRLNEEQKEMLPWLGI